MKYFSQGKAFPMSKTFAVPIDTIIKYMQSTFVDSYLSSKKIKFEDMQYAFRAIEYDNGENSWPPRASDRVSKEETNEYVNTFLSISRKYIEDSTIDGHFDPKIVEEIDHLINHDNIIIGNIIKTYIYDSSYEH